MNDNCIEFVIELPVSQFVKVEACAKEHLRSLDAEASFLLSKWVEATSLSKETGLCPEPQSKGDGEGVAK